VSADEHLVATLDQAGIADEGDRDFIGEIFHGIVRYRKLLRVVTDGFHAEEKGINTPKDQPLFEVSLYLTLVLCSDLGAEAVEQMLKSLSRVDARKVLHLLRFTWDVDNIRTWIKDEWSLLYDRHYVHDRLLQPAEDNWGAMQDILDRLERSVIGKLPSRTPAPVTQTKPFNLTQPKPRTIPVPKPVPNKPKFTPIPKSLYNTPLEQEALQRKRTTNRAKAVRDLEIASGSSRIMSLSTKSHSNRFSDLKSTLAAQEEDSLRKTTKATPIPSTLKRDVTVKLNAGAILREEAHFRQQMNAEKKKLAAIEGGAFNEDAFLEWDLQQQALEEKKRMDEIEMNHLNGMISREEAVLARARVQDEKNLDVRKGKVAQEARMKVYIAEQIKLGQMNRRLVEDTAELYERVYDARLASNAQNAAEGRKVAAESKKLLEEAAERERIENEKRAEIIRQIRALDSTPVDRSKVVDFSESAGHGFLGEMSIAELRERLAMVKAHAAREEADRRSQITREKREEEAQLQRKIETIAIGRSQRTNKPKLSETRAMNAKLASKSKNKGLDELRAKLEAKRAATTKMRATARA
jgi:hypothetical protein